MTAADDLFGAPTACIYILQCDSVRKVGIAGNVGKRIKELQTGAPFPILLIWACRMKRAHAHKVERLIHLELGKTRATPLHPRRPCGEWFREDAEEIVEIAKKIMDFMGIARIEEVGLKEPV